MPAIRPHQKTHLHLRDSATVDFGPAGAALTNNGVTVADDVLTFASGDTIQTDWLPPADNHTVTLSCWHRNSDGSSRGQLLMNTANSSRFLGLYQDGSSALSVGAATVNQFYFDGQPIATPTRDELHSLLSDGEWHHIAIDCVLTSGWTAGVNQIGAYTWATIYNLSGDLADYRLNDGSLTAGEVFDLFANGRGYDLPERRQLPDTVAHLLDGSTDAGFHGEGITLDNTTFENGVYTLSGTTPHIDFGQTRVFSEADGFAFACFFNVTDMDQRRFLWCWGTQTYIELNGATTLRYKASDNTLRFRSYAFTPGQTYHLAVSVEGGVASVYVDGVLDGTIAVSGTSTFSVSQFSTGNATFMFEGDMWDNRMFDRPISAGEVANLYRKGIPSIRRAEVLRIDPALYSGSGDLIDQTGGDNDLTLPSGYTVENGVIVSDGTADGPSTGLTIPSTSGFTMSAWVRTTDTHCVFVYGAGTKFAFCWQDGSASTTFQNASNVQNYVDGVPVADVRGTLHDAVADGEWHHIAVTCVVFGDWDIGLPQYNTATAYRFTGDIDKLAYFDEELTADQIAFLASSREFSDPFPEPFGNLGGEETSIHPERHGLLINEPAPGNTGQGTPTLQGNAEISDGGIALAGGSDRILLNDFALSSSGLPFTVSMWVTRLTGNATMWSSRDGGGTYYMGLAAGGGSAASFGYSNMKHYVNGVDLGSSPTRAEFTAALPVGERVHVCLMGNSSTNQGTGFQIGKYNNNTSLTLNGSVEDVRVFKRQLTPSEVAVLYNDGTPSVELPNTRDAVVAYSPSFNPDSNGAAQIIDLSGNVNHGTLNGTTAIDDDKIVLNGGSGNVDMGAPFTNFVQLSVMAWIRTSDSGPGDYYLAQRGSENDGWWELMGRNGSWRFEVREYQDNNATVNSPSIAMDAATEYQHVCGVFTGSAVQLFVDGVFIGETAFPHDAPFPSVNASIGSIAGASQDTRTADMDDVLLFRRALTPAEVAYYAGQRNIFGEPYVAPPPAPSTGFSGILSARNTCKPRLITGIRA